MNKKSILYIFVVLMALSLTLSAVSADEVAADAADVADEAVVEEAPADDEGAAGGDELLADEDPFRDDDSADPFRDDGVDPFRATATDAVIIADVPVADVATDVEVLEETPLEIVWGIAAVNNGPDVAENVQVFITGSDNLLPYDLFATAGEVVFDPVDSVFVWIIDSLAPGQVEVLLLDTIKMDEGPYYVDAFIQADAFDFDLSNNYDIAWADVPKESAAEETMPAAGNPIAMALLALVAIAGTAFTRRF